MSFCAYCLVLSFFSIHVDVGARLFAGCAGYFFIDEVVRAVVGTVMLVGFSRLVAVGLDDDGRGVDPRARVGRCGVVGFCSVVLGRRFCLNNR